MKLSRPGKLAPVYTRSLQGGTSHSSSLLWARASLLLPSPNGREYTSGSSEWTNQ